MAREIYRAEKVNAATCSHSRVVLSAYDACCLVLCETIGFPLTQVERKQHLLWRLATYFSHKNPAIYMNGIE